jgi:excisionase family DNA binding protein
MALRNLTTHSAHYVTIGELSDYWAVSRQRIYSWIESGALGAIRLGSRIYRVPIQAAIDFERRARVSSAAASNRKESRAPQTESPSVDDKLPQKFGLRLRRITKVVG